MSTKLSFQEALKIKRQIDSDPMNLDLSSRLLLINYCYEEHFNKMSALYSDIEAQYSVNEIFFQNFTDVFKTPSRDYDILLSSLNDLCYRLFPYDSHGKKIANPDTVDHLSENGIIRIISDKTLQPVRRVTFVYKSVGHLNTFIAISFIIMGVAAMGLLTEVPLWTWLRSYLGQSNFATLAIGFIFFVVSASILTSFVLVAVLISEIIKRIGLRLLNKF